MKQRDIELLSSYLDGQLSSSDSTRLEARLRTDPELRSVLQDLRGARSLLRQLPMRKAPRNFTLTPKMVGKNPPLPRSYPAFRFTATLATILLFFTFGLNMVGRQMASPGPAFGKGGGGGGPDSTLSQAQEVAPATEAPAAATEAPAAQEPSIAMSPLSTPTAALDNSTRIMDATVPAAPGAENPAGTGLAQELPAPQPQPAEARTISAIWQWFLAGVALLSVFIMALMRQISASRWRSKI